MHVCNPVLVFTLCTHWSLFSSPAFWCFHWPRRTGGVYLRKKHCFGISYFPTPHWCWGLLLLLHCQQKEQGRAGQGIKTLGIQVVGASFFIIGDMENWLSLETEPRSTWQKWNANHSQLANPVDLFHLISYSQDWSFLKCYTKPGSEPWQAGVIRHTWAHKLAKFYGKSCQTDGALKT